MSEVTGQIIPTIVYNVEKFILFINERCVASYVYLLSCYKVKVE